MLRINLLPSYVTQRRITRRLVVAFAALFLLSVAGPLAAYFVMQQNLTKISQDATEAETGKAKTDALNAKAVTTVAQVKPIQDKLDFVTAVHAYAVSWVKLYNTLAVSSPKSSLIYTDAAVSGSTMTIKAYSPSVAEVGRYLQAIYNEPDFRTVTIDKVPGYPDNVRHLYYYKGKMVFADGASGSAGTGGSGYSSSPSGGYSGRSPQNYSSGGPGGGQTTQGAGAPSGYTPQSLGPNGPSNLPPGVGPPPPELTGAATGTGGGPSGGPGGGQATGGYSPAFLKIVEKTISPFATPEVAAAIRKQALSQVVTKLEPKGFDVTVTATLKQPLTPPGLPGAAPAGRPGRGGPGGPGGGPPPGYGGPGGGPPGGPRPAA